MADKVGASSLVILSTCHVSHSAVVGASALGLRDCQVFEPSGSQPLSLNQLHTGLGQGQSSLGGLTQPFISD